MKIQSDTVVRSNNTPKVRWTAGFLISGVQSLLGNLSASGPSRLQNAMRDIRQSMLDCLAQYGVDAKSTIHMRVSYATDIEDLWYLRGDVMAVIASNDGEVVAKKKLAQISDRFNGLLPRGLTSRTSPLGNQISH
jgi:hypothetical protein